LRTNYLWVSEAGLQIFSTENTVRINSIWRMAVQKNNQGKGQVSPVQKVRLRVSAMISSPRAQAERRALIWKAQGDPEEAWQQVLEELAETDGLKMSLGEDGVVTLAWEAGDEEGVEVVDGIELVQEPDMVIQRLHEERA
ncbi:TPA: DUF1654 domain-containing protein, partial [Pseudomonas aeruginosa]